MRRLAANGGSGIGGLHTKKPARGWLNLGVTLRLRGFNRIKGDLSPTHSKAAGYKVVEV